MMDKKTKKQFRVYKVENEIDSLKMALEMNWTLADDIGASVERYRKEKEAGQELNADELYRKLAFVNNMLLLQIDHMHDHIKGLEGAVKAFK